MARELQDVLHYFLPDEPATCPGPARAAQVVSVPVAPRDVVRRALLWNLAVEAARQGARSALVVPAVGGCAPWPAPGPGPLGVEVSEVETDELAELAAAARSAGLRLAARPGRPAIVLVAVPVSWLRKGADGGALLDRVLLLARPDERELVETWAAVAAITAQAPAARIGACVFGVGSLAEARRAFEGLAALAELELDRSLASFGVLIDDVQLSRSIVSQRPIALGQPGSPAARALADVAGMLIADAADPSGPER